MFHPIIRKMDLDTGRALVREEFFRGHLVRMLTVDGAMESAVYKDKNLRDKPPFYYQESMFSLMAEEEVKDILLIGGGGFTFPRAVLQACPQVRMRVVEIEGAMVDIARECLWFDEIYDREINKRLFITIGDGFDYLRESDEKYDLIINDAFSGSTQDMGLLMPDTAKAVKERLRPGGRYMINLITSRTGEYAMAGMLQKQILSEYFENVELIPVHPDWKAEQRQNYIVIAKNNK